jgi:hypothetical protein
MTHSLPQEFRSVLTAEAVDDSVLLNMKAPFDFAGRTSGGNSSSSSSNSSSSNNNSVHKLHRLQSAVATKVHLVIW